MTKNFLLITAARGTHFFTDDSCVGLCASAPALTNPDILGQTAARFSLANGAQIEPRIIYNHFGSDALDINYLPAALHTHKKLLVADMESTIIEQECLDELASYIGKQEVMRDITARTMRGELAFEAALQARVAMLEGLPISRLDELYAQITLTPGADTLIATMRAHKAVCGLVSGGFDFFTSRIAERLNFDFYKCNDWGIRDGTLDGTIGEPILGRAAKAEITEAQQHQHALATDDILAVGDGANDIAMLQVAGLGVAYHAKPHVGEAAPYRIDHADLTALLYLQGYRQEQFV